MEIDNSRHGHGLKQKSKWKSCEIWRNGMERVMQVGGGGYIGSGVAFGVKEVRIEKGLFVQEEKTDSNGLVLLFPGELKRSSKGKVQSACLRIF